MTINVMEEVSQKDFKLSEIKKNQKPISIEFLFSMSCLISICATLLFFQVSVPKSLELMGSAGIFLGVTLLIVGFWKFAKYKYLVVSISASFIASGMCYMIFSWGQDVNLIYFKKDIYGEFFVYYAILTNWMSLSLWCAVIHYMFKGLNKLMSMNNKNEDDKPVDLEFVHNSTLVVCIILYVISFLSDFMVLAVKYFILQ